MYLVKKALARTRKILNGINEFLFEKLHKSVWQQVPWRRQSLSAIAKKSCNTPVDVTPAWEPKIICAIVDWAVNVAALERASAFNTGKQPLSLSIKAKLVSVAAAPKSNPVVVVAVNVKSAVTFY